jgi:DNA-binding CsgD family transcriptional regulator
MVGLDDNWQKLGSQNKISFSNLDPGTYQLKVRATNNAQLWSSKYSTLEIVVKPTFWQRTIVKIILFAGFIWMLIFVYRLRTSTIQLQREKLQKLLDLKTIEVKEQEQRISQDKISMLEFEKQNQTLKQRKLEDELNFKIDELTNNTLRAMHKNNLLTDIKDKLKTELKNKSIDKKSLENIVDHINDSFILDADWESFYSLFNQVHPTFIKSLKHKYPNLSEREIRLCALILIDFSSQHIATLFGISLTSVKVARHRLRKKLDIPTDTSGKQFMQDISGE